MFSKLENRLRRSTSNLQRDASNASIASTNYEPSPAPSPVSKRNRAKRREEMLTKLPAEYMQNQFDPVLYELQQLPTSFNEQMLDAIVDSRASVLEVWIGPEQAPLTIAVHVSIETYMQVVGEKLSLHVLANYEEFVRGVNEVASIEKDLQVCILLNGDQSKPGPCKCNVMSDAMINASCNYHNAVKRYCLPVKCMLACCLPVCLQTMPCDSSYAL